MKKYWFYSLLVVFIALILFPISSTILRLATVLSVILLWISTMYLWWNRPLIRYLLGGMPFSFMILFMLPGKNFDLNQLRHATVTTLQGFEGTAYVWGGENEIGIDCSGLVRQGLIRANFRVGMQTFNGTLLRESLWLWWHDSSAKALRDEYHGKTRVLLKAPSLNKLDHTQILPGDFAITLNGIHSLAYLGNKTWIEADPAAGKVIIVQVPEKNIIWFDVPVYLMRWNQLNP